MNTLIDYQPFPAVSNATSDGLLAMGGELNLNTLVSAYSQGIFPWFNDEQPVLWWSPDPRMVLFPDEIKVSRSLAKKIKKNHFTVSCDQCFSEVINACALRGEKNPLVPTPGTWITKDMETAYNEMHAQGYAHSIEVWQDKELVGGLYGVTLGKVFFGESMFSRVSDASKIALTKLCEVLQDLGFTIIDCQVSSAHLLTLGAREIPRKEFMHHLEDIDIQQKNTFFSQAFVHPSRDNVITRE